MRSRVDWPNGSRLADVYVDDDCKHAFVSFWVYDDEPQEFLFGMSPETLKHLSAAFLLAAAQLEANA